MRELTVLGAALIVALAGCQVPDNLALQQANPSSPVAANPASQQQPSSPSTGAPTPSVTVQAPISPAPVVAPTTAPPAAPVNLTCQITANGGSDTLDRSGVSCTGGNLGSSSVDINLYNQFIGLPAGTTTISISNVESVTNGELESGGISCVTHPLQGCTPGVCIRVEVIGYSTPLHQTYCGHSVITTATALHPYIDTVWQ